jgi:hypothetical protein
VRTSKINLEMESFVFNPRTIVGSFTVAGVLAVSAAMPAFAADKPYHHQQLKPVAVVRTEPKAAPPVTGATGPVSGLVNNTPAGGLLGALAGLPIVGPLFGGTVGNLGNSVNGATSGLGNAVNGLGNAAGGNPVSGALHGVTSGGLGSITSGLTNTVGGAVDGVAKAVPGGNLVTGLLPGGSVTGALNGLTNGLNGAVSGITNAVPGLGSITGALPKVGG